MPLGDWLKQWSGDQPPEKPESVVIAESLLMELDYQMKEAYERERARRQEEQRARNGGVDYSWLAAAGAGAGPYEMPQLLRLELEELCLRVRPDECARVILQFRSTLVRDPAEEEIPRLLRSVIHQVLEARPPREESMPEWLMRSVTSLSRYRPNPRISPITGPGDGEGSKKSSVASSASMQSFVVEAANTPENVAELPV